MEGLLFANAVVKSRESDIMTQEKIERVLEALTLDSAVKVLLENSYGGGIAINFSHEYEKLLLAEKHRVETFIREFTIKDSGLDCFFIANDYHNLKVIIKSKFLKTKVDTDILEKKGLYDWNVLAGAVLDESVDMNATMRNAINEIEKKAQEEKCSPRFIDVTLDKAMYEEIGNRLSKNCPTIIKDYFKFYIDTINISSLIRTIIIKESLKFFEFLYMPSGSLGKDIFENAYNDPQHGIKNLLDSIKYTADTDFLLSGNIYDLELYRDNYLLNLINEKRHCVDTIAPILRYYLMKMMEIRIFRTILVCKKNNISNEVIRKRISKVLT